MASKIIKNVMQGHMATAMLELLSVNNTVTTLEVKTKLRGDHPEFSWLQKDVSSYMNNLAENDELSYTDNGTFRTYSLVLKKAKKGSVKKKKTVVAKTVKPTPVKVVAPVKVKPTVTAVRPKRISKTKALELILGNKGHFFTAEFAKKNGDLRVMNCQALKKQTSKLGYVTVKEASKMRKDPKNAVRNINLQTITGLRIAGVTYKVS